MYFHGTPRSGNIVKKDVSMRENILSLIAFMGKTNYTDEIGKPLKDVKKIICF
jgi:hypothetical protein